jgi:hypothetical protein
MVEVAELTGSSAALTGAVAKNAPSKVAKPAAATGFVLTYLVQSQVIKF